MNKEFIPYEEALSLRDLGYEGDIIGMYDEDKYLFTLHDQDDIEDEWLPAPLYQQAFRWFREEYGMKFYIKQDNWNHWSTPMIHILETNNDEGICDSYETYEEAELACLKILIEIVKQNKDER